MKNEPLVPYEDERPWYKKPFLCLQDCCGDLARRFGLEGGCLQPCANIVTGSKLPYLSWAVICVVVFVVLIITNGIHETQSEMEVKQTQLLQVKLKGVLAIFMVVSLCGICYCFVRRKDPSFVRYEVLTEESIPVRYLLVGLYVFGFGALLINVMSLLFFIHAEEHACEAITEFSKACWLDYVYSSIKFFFIVLQMAFLQSFWCATLNNTWFNNLMSFHTMATNFCVWLMNIAEETRIFKTEMKKISKPNISIDHFEKSVESFHGTLTPFTLEYSLIVAGILFGIVAGMKNFEAAAQNDEDVDAGSDTNTFISFVENEGNSRQGSQPGLLFGITFAAFLIVSEITIGYTETEQYHKYITIFYGLQIALYILMFISVWKIMTALQSFTKLGKALRPDDKLLIISLVGGIAYDIVVIIAILSCKGLFETHITGMMLASVVLQCVERFFQTWILVLSHRYRSGVDNAARTASAKIIRQNSLFLLFTNLGIWALDTFFELKDFGDKSYPCGPYSFGPEWWDKLQAFLYPICIFYRFHAATMSFDIWGHFRFQRR